MGQLQPCQANWGGNCGMCGRRSTYFNMYCCLAKGYFIHTVSIHACEVPRLQMEYQLKDETCAWLMSPACGEPSSRSF